MSIDDDVALLEAVPLLALLGREPLRVLAIGAENRFVPEGEVLFRAGDAADAGYVVQEGSFRLTPASGDASRGSLARPGTLLGELALITETRRPLTAIAAEPSSVMRIPRLTFLKMLEGYPHLAVRLREALAARSTQIVDELGFVRGLLHQGSD